MSQQTKSFRCFSNPWSKVPKWFHAKSCSAIVPMLDLVNHSKKPNSKWTANSLTRFPLVITAISKIAPDQELYIDYGNSAAINTQSRDSNNFVPKFRFLTKNSELWKKFLII